MRKTRKQKAISELNDYAEKLFHNYDDPNEFGKQLDEQCKKIASRYSLKRDNLWKWFISAKPEKIDVSQSLPKKKLKDLKLVIKLIQARTPHSSWWVAKSIPGLRMRKKLEKIVGKRVVVFPGTHYLLVRIPDNQLTEKWIDKKTNPFQLLQRLDRLATMRMIMMKRIKPLPEYRPVMGSLYKTIVKKLKKKPKRKKLFKKLKEEVIDRKIQQIIETKGKELGFQRVESFSGLYSSGKETFSTYWICPREVVHCPCAFKKDCITFKILKEEINNGKKDKEKRKKEKGKKRRKKVKKNKKSRKRSNRYRRR